MVREPPRWIANAIYQLSCHYLPRPDLYDGIGQLWEAACGSGDNKFVEMGLSWLLEMTTLELSRMYTSDDSDVRLLLPS